MQKPIVGITVLGAAILGIWEAASVVTFLPAFRTPAASETMHIEEIDITPERVRYLAEGAGGEVLAILDVECDKRTSLLTLPKNPQATSTRLSAQLCVEGRPEKSRAQIALDFQLPTLPKEAITYSAALAGHLSH